MSASHVRQHVRDLLEANLQRGTFTPVVDCWLRSVDHSFSRQLGDEGLLGMTWPRLYGGGEQPNTDRLAVTEELLRAGAPVTAHWVAERQIGPTILRLGTDALKREVLPKIIAGDSLIALGMSEPESGSDLASISTRADRTDGGWLLNGRKVWTTQAHRATEIYVLARTSEGVSKHDGLSEFIIDMQSPGILVSPIVDLAGQHHFNEVEFDSVFIPSDRLIGAVGGGWKQVVEQLSFERGGPERALSTWVLMRTALSSTHRREDDGAKRDTGQMIATLASLRFLYRRVAEALDAGEAPVRLAAASKVLGNEFEKELINTVRRLVPTPDSETEAMIAQALWASPAFGLRGGSSDVLLNLVSRFELPRDLSSVKPLIKESDPDLQDLLELTARVGGGSVAEVDRDDHGRDRLIDVVRELEWDSVSVPSEEGGAGGSVRDAATILRGLARLGVDTELQHGLVEKHEAMSHRSPFKRGSLSALFDAAILIGASEGALALTVRYVVERHQFGAPLAKIPAVSAKIARLRIQLDLALGAYNRALRLHQAMESEDSSEAQAIILRSSAFAAKVTAAQSGGVIADEAHQLHGAIGITDEYPLHHLTKLIWATRDAGVTEHTALLELGSLGLEGGENAIWDVLTDTDPFEV